MIAACGSGAAHRGRTVVYASGADLQSATPLLTSHPLAKQVQRYVLLTTLVRYDSALTPRPYLARAWTWSADQKSLTFRLQPGVRWDDGLPTTDRKSTRLNSSHLVISYAVFCLKKKKPTPLTSHRPIQACPRPSGSPNLRLDCQLLRDRSILHPGPLGLLSSPAATVLALLSRAT